MQSCRWTWSEALQELFQVSCWMRLCDKVMHVVMSWLEPYSWSITEGSSRRGGIRLDSSLCTFMCKALILNGFGSANGGEPGFAAL
jgi:hypothetical protein